MIEEERIKELIIKIFKDAANKAFLKTQESCPVRTGKLKKSGMYFDYGMICGFMYTIPYASIVEHGQSEGANVIGPYYTSTGNRVRGYISSRPRKEGHHFIENAINSIRVELNSNVDSALRSNFKVES